MTTKGYVVAKGTADRVYSLADCEEGRVRNKVYRQFRYPSVECTNDSTETVKTKDKLHLFKWHYTDETDSISVLQKHSELTCPKDEENEENVALQDSNNNFSTNKWKYDDDDLADNISQKLSGLMAELLPVEKTGYTPSQTLSVHRYVGEKSDVLEKQSSAGTEMHFPDPSVVVNSNLLNNNAQPVNPPAVHRQRSSINRQNAALFRSEYPHLTEQEVCLLKKGMTLYKHKEYPQALECYEEGSRLNPTAKEFQHLKVSCQKKINKKAEKKKLFQVKSTGKTKERKTSICWSGSQMESQEMFTSRQKYLLQQAEQCLSHGDFQTAYNYSEKGLQLLPDCKVFQKVKYKAYDGILMSMGVKAAYDDFEQNLVVMKLIKAQQFVQDEEHHKAIEQCHTVIQSINKLPLHQLPHRSSLIATAFGIMGNCYVHTDNVKMALKSHLQELGAAIESNNDEIKAGALSKVGTVYVKMKQYEKAILVWKQIFEHGIDTLNEKSWLYHEIGHCYLELRDFESAKKYAELSLASAIEANQGGKKITAALLAAHAALRNGSAQESKIAFGRALYYAVEEGDVEAKSSIETAIREIDAVIKEQM